MNENKYLKNELIKKIIDTVYKLEPEKQQEFYKMLEQCYIDNEIQRIRRNPIPNPEQTKMLFNLVTRAEQKNTDPVLLYIDIFLYGVIEGKREERRRRNRTQAD